MIARFSHPGMLNGGSALRFRPDGRLVFVPAVIGTGTRYNGVLDVYLNRE